MEQTFDVDLEATAPDIPRRTVRVQADDRDVAQLEMQDWYGANKMITSLRHLAFTALRRQGRLPQGCSWERFNEELCVAVMPLPDEDESEGEQSVDPGQTATTAATSSTSHASPASHSWDQLASSPGIPGMLRP